MVVLQGNSRAINARLDEVFADAIEQSKGNAATPIGGRICVALDDED